MNTSHLPGRNIPLDLHMEHSNRLAKSAMRNLGSNKTREKSIARVGRSLGTLVPLLERFDEENAVKANTSAYKKLQAAADIRLITKELVTSNCFSVERITGVNLRICLNLTGKN